MAFNDPKNEEFSGNPSENLLEGYAKKSRQMFFFIVFSILMIMFFCVYILKVDTLTIPKW